MVNINRRRRNISACNFCRVRRTKCDGSRPKCGNCARRNIDCIYSELLSPIPSRVEIELCSIRDQLNSVEKLLSFVPQRGCCLVNQASTAVPISGWDREQNSRADELRSSSVPYMVIQNEAFMILIGLKRDLAHHIADAERAVVPTLHPSPLGVRNFFSRGSSPISTVTAFFNKIHTWYPILSVRQREKLCSTGDPPRISSERCLFLILMAIGSLAQCESLPVALSERPDAPLMEEVLLILPTVLLESSLTALQCLIFISTYYLCLVKPCQAHDYILIASMRAQNMLKSASLDPENQELIRRALWVVLLIERELSTQLDLTSRSVWTLDNEVPLPSWSQLTDQALPSNSSAPTDSPSGSFSSSQSSSHLFSYFLAEIAMRRMLQRSTASAQSLPNGKQMFAPVISAELEMQLEQWHSHLPEFLRFDRCFISECNMNPQLLFLRTQYHAYRASILWPAVHQAMVEGEEYDETLRPFCLEFYEAYTRFILSAVACIPQCLPNTWTLYASVFTITMAALRAKESPALSSIMSPEVWKSFHSAVQLFDDILAFGPSLHMMHGILAEAVANLAGEYQSD